VFDQYASLDSRIHSKLQDVTSSSTEGLAVQAVPKAAPGRNSTIEVTREYISPLSTLQARKNIIYLTVAQQRVCWGGQVVTERMQPTVRLNDTLASLYQSCGQRLLEV
jgi:hypothetical protein